MPATATQARLREATLKVMARPAIRERLNEIRFDPGQSRTPDELTKQLRTDFDRGGAILGVDQLQA